MNLVSYEFVACQASKKGVLILSEVVIFSLLSNELLLSLQNLVIVDTTRKQAGTVKL